MLPGVKSRIKFDPTPWFVQHQDCRVEVRAIRKGMYAGSREFRCTTCRDEKGKMPAIATPHRPTPGLEAVMNLVPGQENWPLRLKVWWQQVRTRWG